MKVNSINILSVLIILILAGSISLPVYLGVQSFLYGFKEGLESAESDKPMKFEDATFDVAFNPQVSVIYQQNDSITFKSGDTYPFVIMRGLVSVPDKKVANTRSIVNVIVNIAIFALFIALVVDLIKFVVNVNRGVYFESKNMKRLCRFGCYLLIMAALECVGGICDDYFLSTLNLKLTGYFISSYWNIPFGTTLLGLLALMMANVWQRAISIKEEQELTI